MMMNRMGGLHRVLLGLAFAGIALFAGTAWAGEGESDAGFQMTPVPGAPTAPAHSSARAAVKTPPLMLAEGSNSCEIVSCGMGIKQSCQITCPANQTPKCSCDCVKSFGPMCTEYKANCRCE